MERAIAEHELAQRIIARVSGTPVITIDRYGEVFNRAGQNFRLQKRAPALILAKKHGKTVGGKVLELLLREIEWFVGTNSGGYGVWRLWDHANDRQVEAAEGARQIKRAVGDMG